MNTTTGGNKIMPKTLHWTEKNVRISQIFNNPGNLTLNKIVQYARALGLKVAVIAYDDGDHINKNGPISSEIFNICWENAGKPKDFFGLQTSRSKLFTSDRGLISNVPIGAKFTAASTSRIDLGDPAWCAFRGALETVKMDSAHGKFPLE
jgi:hypothetical protein